MISFFDIFPRDSCFSLKYSFPSMEASCLNRIRTMIRRTISHKSMTGKLLIKYCIQLTLFPVSFK